MQEIFKKKFSADSEDYKGSAAPFFSLESLHACDEAAPASAFFASGACKQSAKSAKNVQKCKRRGKQFARERSSNLPQQITTRFSEDSDSTLFVCY